MSLSTALTLTDLSDYLAPSQACIKPVEFVPDPDGQEETGDGDGVNDGKKDSGAKAETEIRIDPETKEYYEVEISKAGVEVNGMMKGQGGGKEGKKKKLKKAEITLNDCLACSGCITSAESVLVSLQSHTQLISDLTALRSSHHHHYSDTCSSSPSSAVESSKEEEGHSTCNDSCSAANGATKEPLVVMSIAPQSVASLAAYHEISKVWAMRGIREWVGKKDGLGIQLVFDTTLPRSLTLYASRHEILESLTTRLPSSSILRSLLTSSSSLSNPQTTFDDPKSKPISNSPLGSVSNPSNNVSIGTTKDTSPTLPILSSACPGWICYAEKTHPELLPFMSRVRSPMAMAGGMVKGGWVGGKMYVDSQDIYHVSVMPCYDKKLEASRPDFHLPSSTDQNDQTSPSSSGGATGGNAREIDCVLTTGELQKMMEEDGFDLGEWVEERKEEEEGFQKAKTPSSSRVVEDSPNSNHPNGYTPLNGATNSTTKTPSIPPLCEEDVLFPSLSPTPGTSSGSYLQNAIQAVIGALDPVTVWPRLRIVTEERRAGGTTTKSSTPTSTSSKSQPDWVDWYIVMDSTPKGSSNDGGIMTPDASRPEIIFKAAKCYGFRNLQNLVRRVGKEAGVTVSKGAAGKVAGSLANDVGDSFGFGASEASNDEGALSRAAIAAAKAKEARERRAARRAGTASRKAGGMNTPSSTPSSSGMLLGEDKPYDYVEVMACPSGCVNGGGQIPPPKPADSEDQAKKERRRERRRQQQVGGIGKGKEKFDFEMKTDQEGMPVLKIESDDLTPGLLQDSEMKIAGEVAADGTTSRVFTAKEWVERVEQLYWAQESGNSMGSNPRDSTTVSLHPSLLPFINVRQSSDSVQDVAEELLRANGDRDGGPNDKVERWKNVFETDFRAIESGEVNGLAVQW